VPEERLLDPTIVRERMQPSGLADTAYQMIREAMLAGRIKPGTWLRQRDLAAELGVSQVTVREALNRLVAAGLATRERYRGVRTLAGGTDDREELLTLRAMLEGWAAEQAAPRISAADLARLRASLLRSSNVGRQSTERAQAADRAFHWIIIHASERRHLIHLLQHIWEAQPNSIASMGTLDANPVVQRTHQRAHRHLVEALEARDGERARGILVEHVRQALRGVAESEQPQEQQHHEDAPVWLVRGYSTGEHSEKRRTASDTR
jgi:DNA-binding GntR family transcriptional regulator